jgi:glycosyltransferase involved in cell wall biosynthesis
VAAFVAEHDGSVSRSAQNRTGPVRFLYLGRIDVEPKGLDILVKGFATALRDSLDPASATLTMVGPDTGGGADRLRLLATRLAVEHAVRIRAPVPQSNVPSVLEECDVYVQLSRNEGSPLSLNDALFMGKPAIISDSIGTASDPAVSSLEHVLVVPATPESAAHAFAQAVAAIDQLGESARSAQPQVRALLSWPSVAAKHLGLYKALAQSSRIA